MKLRKILSILLSVSILLSATLVCGGSVSAATLNSIYSDTNLKAMAGNTIAVPIRISGNMGLMGYDMSFTYDDKVLTPVSVTRGNVLTEGFFQDDIEGTTSTNNRFRVSWSHTNQSAENGILFYLNFNVNSQAVGSTEILVDYDKTDTYDGNFDDVTLNCSNINIAINNNEYDGKPVFRIIGTDIAAGDMLSLDFYAENIGNVKQVTLTLPYDNENFQYSGLILNGVQAAATDNGDSVSINISDLSKVNSGKIFTVKMQSESFATSQSYSFSAQYSNLVGADKMLVKGTEIAVSSTNGSDSVVIYSSETNRTEYGEKQLIIPLYIKHNTGLMGYTLTFNYDSNILEAVSANAGSGFNGSFSTNIGKEAGKFTCLWFANDNVYSNGVFLTLTFNVLSQDESTGNITVSYNEKDIISEKTDGVKLGIPDVYYVVNSQVYLLGDVDGDKRIIISDATTIQKYLAEFDLPNKDIIEKCGDVDGDGRITITDATTIQKYLAEYTLPYDIGKPMT